MHELQAPGTNSRTAQDVNCTAPNRIFICNPLLELHYCSRSPILLNRSSLLHQITSSQVQDSPPLQQQQQHKDGAARTRCRPGWDAQLNQQDQGGGGCFCL